MQTLSQREGPAIIIFIYLKIVYNLQGQCHKHLKNMFNICLYKQICGNNSREPLHIVQTDADQLIYQNIIFKKRLLC